MRARSGPRSRSRWCLVRTGCGLLPALIGWCGLLHAEGAPSGRSHGAAASQAPALKSWVAARLPGPPEGLARGPDQALYASIPKIGAVVRLDGKGGFTQIATVPSAELARAGRIWGAEFGPDGALYVTYLWGYSLAEEEDPLHLGCRNSKDVHTGIYRVDIASGRVEPYLTKADGWPVCFPDDVAFDARGALYVTDATLSGIWKIEPDRHVRLWSADALLQWPAAPLRTLPEGANDLIVSHDGRTLYVATDGYPAVVSIPIQSDGTAGAATAIAHDLTPLDGIELDDEGNIYVSEILRDTIRVFSPDGSKSAVVATSESAPISGPTSLIYDRGTLCVANYGWDVEPEPTTVTCMRGFRKPSASH